MVRKLVGKDPTADLTPEDLKVAMEIIRTKFVMVHWTVITKVYIDSKRS